MIPAPVYPLLTSACWALAVIYFKRSGESFDPIALNVFKNVIGLVLMLATLPLLGSDLFEIDPTDAVILAVAGAVGIGLADTLFFFSLNALGATRQAIVDCSYSPFIVFFSMVWLGERLGMADVAGGALIVSAMLLAVFQRPDSELSQRRLITGLLCGTGAMAAMGISIVAVKPILEQYDVLSATLLRLGGGLLSMAPLMLHRGIRGRTMAVFIPHPAWKYAVPGAVLGTYLSLLFWIAGFKFNLASVASLLNQTSTLFIVIFAALILRERPTRRSLIGVGLGIVGSILVIVPFS